MKGFLVAVALVAAASAMTLKDDILIGKDNLNNIDIKSKEFIIMKMLNHILQPSMYNDVTDCAKDFNFETNMDKFVKKDAVKTFLDTYSLGMLPRGEVFVHNNQWQMEQAIKVFHVLYFAKDFDTFVRCCCWMRERINEGMFVYALTVAVLHREDCRGIVLPAPYEIYPYFFVNSDVIHKVFMMKMKKGVVDRTLLEYYNIQVTDKNIVVIDSRKDLRQALSVDDRLRYFTEDIDLNTYYYYFHMDYPTWMVNDNFDVNKERRGEIMMYGMQQLLARYRLERLSNQMCDIKPFMLRDYIKTGYWPRIRMHNGEEMPMRVNNKKTITEENLYLKRIVDDMETMIRTAILTGRLEMRDGTVLKINKPEDIEYVCRYILNTFGWTEDNKSFNLMNQLKKIVNYGTYNMNKYTYIPTAMDMYQTCLRDPVYWQLMKRVLDNVNLFKKMMPRYTRDELNFPGVKIENVSADKLVTYIDEYDMDVTNAAYLDKTEMTRRKSDYLFVARQRRLNNQPFKLTIDIVSDKAVDSIVRVFLGPKYDCMGRLMSLNDKRQDMVEIDSFLYKLENGKNTIVRNSMDMHNVLGDRAWTRRFWDRDTIETLGTQDHMFTDSWWYRSRIGYPHRLLLPMGRLGGLEMQLYVIVTPVRTGMMNNKLDIDTMRQRKVCRFTTCIDTMPLGFPFDREIDSTNFWCNNMRMADVMIFHKELETTNGVVKGVDTTYMKMKHDDYTYMDKDMLVKSNFYDYMLGKDDYVTRM